MEWINLQQESQLEEIHTRSFTRTQVIYKHSTRCSISSVVKSRLERSEKPKEMDFYYLDLIRFRSLSNKIAEVYKVFHESPQVLAIRNGECIYDESHMSISMQELESALF